MPRQDHKQASQREPNLIIYTGEVKFFLREKGFGFIAPDKLSEDAKQDPDVFVYHTAIQGEGYRNLAAGDRVSFQVVDLGRGPQAKGVKRIS